jgi:hypothetical protein
MAVRHKLSIIRVLGEGLKQRRRRSRRGRRRLGLDGAKLFDTETGIAP